MANIDKEGIRSVIETKIDGGDLFVVDIIVSPSLDVEVIMDSDSGVSIEQCIEITKAIEEQFDREVQDYSLTVGSAGVGSALKLPRQFQKIVGKDVEIILNNGVKIIGRLIAHDEDGVEVRYAVKEVVEGKKRKIEVEKIDKYNFLEIKTVCEALFV